MSAYIKLSTLDYPRHIGDIENDPAGMSDYAHVEWRDPLAFNKATERCVEAAPVQENSFWYMVWSIRAATPQEIEEGSKPFNLRGY